VFRNSEGKRHLLLVEEIVDSLHRKADSKLGCMNSRLVLAIGHFSEMVINCYRDGGKLIVFGNGGSSSDASHFCSELTGRFKEDRKPYPAICLNDSSFLTAVGNDYGFDHVFERGVSAFGNKGDLVVAISTSGNSTNCVLGIARAKEMGLDTVCLLGRDGGLMANYPLVVNVRMDSTDSIQEMHMSILHTVVEVVEKALDGE
jgi:D-sedoheptulose 7-phosphate isomerase